MSPTVESPHREVTITPYRDGPLLVRGAFRLQDSEGREIDPGREIVALCRCGRSRIRPFCDGSHKLTHFRAPSGVELRGNLELRGDLEPRGDHGLRDDAGLVVERNP